MYDQHCHSAPPSPQSSTSAAPVRRPGARALGRALILGCLAVGAVPALANDGRPGAREVSVVTFNQYLGADLNPLVTAPPEGLNAAVLAVLGQVAANRFRARAREQAALIAGQKPDLVGLQEVWDFACQDLPPVAGACAEPSIRGAFLDQLEVTLAALKARGAQYRVAAGVTNFDTAEIAVPFPGGTLNGLPFTINGKNALLLAKDRDVILRRDGVRTRPVTFAGCTVSWNGCNYAVQLEVPIPALGTTIAFKRGFVAVDAEVRGRKRRFVNTHLEVQQPVPNEPTSMFFQSGQAQQLITTLAATALPAGSALILVGDLNSAPTEKSPAPGIVPPYRQLVTAGYLDSWAARNGRRPGPTCCQDEDLRNRASKLTDRIDHVFVATKPVLVTGAERIGENVADKTPWLPGRPALWPSDHAGVSTSLHF